MNFRRRHLSSIKSEIQLNCTLVLWIRQPRQIACQGHRLSLSILDGEVISLYILEHPLESGWCSEEGRLGNHFEWLVISYHSKGASVQVRVEATDSEHNSEHLPVPELSALDANATTDRPAELLRQGLSLNCLPPAWWVLLGQSI